MNKYTVETCVIYRFEVEADTLEQALDQGHDFRNLADYEDTVYINAEPKEDSE